MRSVVKLSCKRSVDASPNPNDWFGIETWVIDQSAVARVHLSVDRFVLHTAMADGNRWSRRNVCFSSCTSLLTRPNVNFVLKINAITSDIIYSRLNYYFLTSRGHSL